MLYNDGQLASHSFSFPKPTQSPLLLKTIAASAMILSASATALLYLGAPLPTVILCGAGSLLAFTIHLIGTALLTNNSKQKSLFEQLVSELKKKDTLLQEKEREILSAHEEIIRLNHESDLKIDANILIDKEAEILDAQEEIAQLKQDAADRAVDDLMNDIEIETRAKKLIRQNILTNNICLLDWMKLMSTEFTSFIRQSELIRDDLLSLFPDSAPVLAPLDANQDVRRSPQKRFMRAQNDVPQKKLQEISQRLEDQKDNLTSLEEKLLLAVQTASAQPELLDT